jgi:hypothetical protein
LTAATAFYLLRLFLSLISSDNLSTASFCPHFFPTQQSCHAVPFSFFMIKLFFHGEKKILFAYPPTFFA